MDTSIPITQVHHANSHVAKCNFQPLRGGGQVEGGEDAHPLMSERVVVGVGHGLWPTEQDQAELEDEVELRPPRLIKIRAISIASNLMTLLCSNKTLPLSLSSLFIQYCMAHRCRAVEEKRQFLKRVEQSSLTDRSICRQQWRLMHSLLGVIIAFLCFGSRRRLCAFYNRIRLPSGSIAIQPRGVTQFSGLAGSQEKKGTVWHRS